MATTPRASDYEGSYLLGEADGENWACDAHPNETQSISMLNAEDIGQRDIFGLPVATFLLDHASIYDRQDSKFDANAYFEGFLAAVRRTRQQRAFAFAGKHSRW